MPRLIYIPTHVYFQENCKADAAKLAEIGGFSEDLFLSDGPYYGILVFLLMCNSQVNIYVHVNIFNWV